MDYTNLAPQLEFSDFCMMLLNHNSSKEVEPDFWGEIYLPSLGHGAFLGPKILSGVYFGRKNRVSGLKVRFLAYHFGDWAVETF